MAIILIIDDDLNFCETMESLVIRMGHEFLSAGTLARGMELLQTQEVDILLLDVRLPDGDGLSALPRIKETALSAPEIFIITGLGIPTALKPPLPRGYGTISSSPHR